jgi:hypothetical protein
MDLGPNKISGTYQFVLNQSGATPITLGNNSAVNWNAGGVVATTGDQTISGVKTFDSTIIGSINGNAESVTSGVYLTGTQIIVGNKIFTSTIGGNINGNAGSVTNGVFTTGNQTIAGTKNFSSTIGGSITGNAATATNAAAVTNGV